MKFMWEVRVNTYPGVWVRYYADSELAALKSAKSFPHVGKAFRFEIYCCATNNGKIYKKSLAYFN